MNLCETAGDQTRAVKHKPGFRTWGKFAQFLLNDNSVINTLVLLCRIVTLLEVCAVLRNVLRLV